MPGGRESWTGNLHIKSSFQPTATCEPYLDPDSESTNCGKKKRKEKLWQLEVWTLDWIFYDWGISGRFLDVVIVLWLSWKGSYLLAIHTLKYRWNGKMSWMCFKMRWGGWSWLQKEQGWPRRGRGGGWSRWGRHYAILATTVNAWASPLHHLKNVCCKKVGDRF